jgi:Alpha amylase, catalytic domain
MKVITLLLAVILGTTPTLAQSYRDRLPQDELIYFLLPDRFENGDTSNDKGGLSGDRLTTGFDPSAKGFYHGGDLKGLIKRLDYIQGLGATAIWVAPIFKNQAVRGAPGDESAGYHGYWVTDFTTVDPHFGTEADFKALAAAAHGRGMKVYMDIITNHTADIIKYRECTICAYRSRADYPDHAYTPYIPKGLEHAKVPDWLNDISLYHNRGNSTFEGESSTMGDFVELDDVKTEEPRAVALCLPCAPGRRRRASPTFTFLERSAGLASSPASWRCTRGSRGSPRCSILRSIRRWWIRSRGQVAPII